MKIFIGIPVDKNTQSKYLEFKNKHKNLKVNWLEPNDIHITLIPPWKTENVEGEILKLETLKNALKSILVRFNTVEAKRNLIWASGPFNIKLEELKKELEKVFKSSERERKLIPHITLARKREALLSSKRINWTLEVGKIALYESISNFKKKRYKILHKINLND